MSELDERPLEGRLILLGVTGSIAAYKAAELVRQLLAAGAEVQVMMSRTATAFIGPLTMETLSGHPVMLDPLEQRGVVGRGRRAGGAEEEGEDAHDLTLTTVCSLGIPATEGLAPRSPLAVGGGRGGR